MLEPCHLEPLKQGYSSSELRVCGEGPESSLLVYSDPGSDRSGHGVTWGLRPSPTPRVAHSLCVRGKGCSGLERPSLSPGMRIHSQAPLKTLEINSEPGFTKVPWTSLGRGEHAVWPDLAAGPALPAPHIRLRQKRYPVSGFSHPSP